MVGSTSRGHNILLLLGQRRSDGCAAHMTRLAVGRVGARLDGHVRGGLRCGSRGGRGRGLGGSCWLGSGRAVQRRPNRHSAHMTRLSVRRVCLWRGTAAASSGCRLLRRDSRAGSGQGGHIAFWKCNLCSIFGGDSIARSGGISRRRCLLFGGVVFARRKRKGDCDDGGYDSDGHFKKN